MSRYLACAQAMVEEEVDNINELRANITRHIKRNKKMPISQEVRYRVVVLGATGVGKSTIVSQFMYGCQPEALNTADGDTDGPLWTTSNLNAHTLNTTSSRQPTGELHEIHYDVADKRLTLEVVEVTDEQRHSPEWKEIVSSGDAFVIVYSVSDDSSREAVSSLRTEVLEEHCYMHVPVVVVANKTDTDDGTRHVQNVITEMVALEEWGHGHTSTSATDADSISSIFSELFRQVEFPPDHVMKFWLNLHNKNINLRQRKRDRNIFRKLSKRVRQLIGGQKSEITKSSNIIASLQKS